jgi:uncharacterized protein with von Willebrand factor type A (vWA) domain
LAYHPWLTNRRRFAAGVGRGLSGARRGDSGEARAAPQRTQRVLRHAALGDRHAPGTGKLADNLQLGFGQTDNVTGFGRALRRAGVRLDSARIALAQQAALLVGVDSKPDLSAAMEAVLVSREQDRMVFRELFDVYFRNPEVANKLLSQMLPSAEGKAEPAKRRPRVREALQPQKPMASRPSPSRRPEGRV